MSWHSTIQTWFLRKQWEPYPHQVKMRDAFISQKDALLLAPTVGGKTLSGFLPSIQDLLLHPGTGLHTLYLSPLKALSYDVEKNLQGPLKEMQLSISVETRTGDTSSFRRQRQQKKPPSFLLTTPESLELLLSYPTAREFFKTLRLVIIDEIHSLAPSKRGDLTALLLSRLLSLAPTHQRFGLSATTAFPESILQWLCLPRTGGEIVRGDEGPLPQVQILKTKNFIPWAGYFPDYAIEEICEVILKARSTILFVNVRSHAESLYHILEEKLGRKVPLGIHHGSLSKEERLNVERAMVQGELRGVVATASLDLGIDWGNVDQVLQIGAPKGVSRLVQRIGRSNHRLDMASKAFVVPTNLFQSIEALASLQAIQARELDGEKVDEGAWDVVPQYMVNCACSEPFDPNVLFQEITRSLPYQTLSREKFDALLDYSQNGGYVLSHYERYQRLRLNEEGHYELTSEQFRRRHRMNLGTIVEDDKIRVKLMGRSRLGKYLGEIEESFILPLKRGDHFLFSGIMVEYCGIRDQSVEVRKSRKETPKIPIYAGGSLPLSGFLAGRVRHILGSPKRWTHLPEETQMWLQKQQRKSAIPHSHEFLSEVFPRNGLHYWILYPFAGHAAHQTLALLLTLGMEERGLKPLGYVRNDYSLGIWSMEKVEDPTSFLRLELLEKPYELWIHQSYLMKRAFRKVAIVSGLIERRLPGKIKTGRQVTFSTDLIYDVLLQYEPDHILIQMTRQELNRHMIGGEKLQELLKEMQGKILHKKISKTSPLSLNVLLEMNRLKITGEGDRLVMEKAFRQLEDEVLISEAMEE